MNLQEISLSIYSFGYSAGFLHDERDQAAAATVTIQNIADLASAHGLGGIEFPVDRYFPLQRMEDAEQYIADLQARGLRTAVDLENFDPAYVRALLPLLSRRGIDFARIKMGNFYGGNRYREATFEADLQTFVDRLQSLLAPLREHGVRLLIENHQDIGADDLVRVIGRTSADCVGITWDMGNSLPVPETPVSFLDKTAGFIGNVHLKDYRLFRTEEGYRLSRCALGEGVIEFGSLLRTLRARQGAVPMAIELGAQNARHADVFRREYWEAYPACAVTEKIDFFAFLNRRLEDGDGWRSPWERDQSGEQIIAAESRELEQSVAFLAALEV